MRGSVAIGYFGKHFLAGALLGGIVLAAAYLLWLSPAAAKMEYPRL